MQAETDIPVNERQKLYNSYKNKLEVADNFNRKLVSFQANKDEPHYRWFKYKEGFSSSLVKYFLKKYHRNPGKLLDPFSGAGTTLFAGQELGWETTGIELLPVGVFVTKARKALKNADITELNHGFTSILNNLHKIDDNSIHYQHISITKDAYPEETEYLINKYLSSVKTLSNESIKVVLEFVLISVLEEISYTRKDGQYLRWDYRSVRELAGKPFDKGKILTFEEAVIRKFNQIKYDLLPNSNGTLFDLDEKNNHFTDTKNIHIIEGSCLEKMPLLDEGSFDFVITSPPYCNRYDYTRTYALELVLLGKSKEEVRALRQAMLSCTVENKEKIALMEQYYDSLGQIDAFNNVLKVYNNSRAMKEVNETLCLLNKEKKLNNSNIPRMVKNYFLELCFVIWETSRVLNKGGYCVMVNDNVRYGGEDIPVDIILSEFAENFGFDIVKIYVLPRGKGNSSQQMGLYGRSETRKCIYLWQKK